VVAESLLAHATGLIMLASPAIVLGIMLVMVATLP